MNDIDAIKSTIGSFDSFMSTHSESRSSSVTGTAGAPPEE